jgi:hypothetical protein
MARNAPSLDGPEIRTMQIAARPKPLAGAKIVRLPLGAGGKLKALLAVPKPKCEFCPGRRSSCIA